MDGGDITPMSCAMRGRFGLYNIFTSGPLPTDGVM